LEENFIHSRIIKMQFSSMRSDLIIFLSTFFLFGEKKKKEEEEELNVYDYKIKNGLLYKSGESRLRGGLSRGPR
jgi:hypothetical protein